MYAAAVAAAAARQNDTSVFATGEEYEAELQLIAANQYTLEQNFQRRHVDDCTDMLSPLNRGLIPIGTGESGVVLPPRWASTPQLNTGVNPPIVLQCTASRLKASHQCSCD